LNREKKKRRFIKHVSYFSGAFAVFTLGSGIATLVYGVFLLLRYIGIEFNYGVFNLYTLSIVLIVVGSLLIITVILGVIGALKDTSNLRMATLGLLFILFAVLGKSNNR
jgi:choline-glycine betaine transporter